VVGCNSTRPPGRPTAAPARRTRPAARSRSRSRRRSAPTATATRPGRRARRSCWPHKSWPRAS